MVTLYRGCVFLGLLVCVVLVEAHRAANTVPCSRLSELPAVWLNSTTQATKIEGNAFTAYSLRPDGVPHLGTWHRMRWYEIQELKLVETPSSPPRCPTAILTPAAASELLLRALDFEASCVCTATTGSRPLEQNTAITENFYDLEVLRPDWPDFKLTLTFSLVNEPWSTIVPASPETFLLEYPMNWTTHAPKFSFRISNWNWTSPGTANSTLRLYFYQSVGTDEDTTVTYSEQEVPFLSFTMNTSNTFFETRMLRAFTADGVDYVISSIPGDPELYILAKDLTLTVPVGTSLCHGFQPINVSYSDLFYDPSIVALFTGSIDSPETNSESENTPKKQRLNPAAYVVPIVVVVILIVTIVALTIYVPSFRQRIKPFSKRSTTTPNERMTNEATGNNRWTSSSTPAPI